MGTMVEMVVEMDMAVTILIEETASRDEMVAEIVMVAGTMAETLVGITEEMIEDIQTTVGGIWAGMDMVEMIATEVTMVVEMGDMVAWMIMVAMTALEVEEMVDMEVEEITIGMGAETRSEVDHIMTVAQRDGMTSLGMVHGVEVATRHRLINTIFNNCCKEMVQTFIVLCYH